LGSAAYTRTTAEPEWVLPSRGRVGMFSLIGAESAVFTIFVVAYIFYIGKSVAGPTPQDVLELPIFGTIFLVSTGLEWRHLIYDKGLTVSTNLFGTTYYSLVGLHAFHVTVGLLMIALAMILTLFGKVKPEHSERAEVFSLYWHFVDVVWVIVFTVVYIIGR
jgi:cytochrome c oxidase subunit 3